MPVEKFTLHVEGFGPITSHSVLRIERGSLSVWFGPSGSGKSFVAKLIYAFSSPPLRLVENWEEAFQRSLFNVFGDYWEKLVSAARIVLEGDGALLRIENGEFRIIFDERRVRSILRSDERVVKAREACSDTRVFELYGGIDKCLSSVGGVWKSAIQHELLTGRVLGYAVHEATGLPLEPMVSFLGFVRSSVLLLLSNPDLDLIEWFTHSSGPVRTLLGEVIRLVYSMPEGDIVEHIGRYDAFTALLASRLLLGARLLVKKTSGRFSATLVARDYEVPVHSVAAAIAEAAPLLALLLRAYKDWARGRGLVIVEEPETQLHPDLQRLVFWLLLRLASKGHTVIVTTHSPFIASEARTAILMGMLDKHKRREAARIVAKSLLEDEEINGISEAFEIAASTPVKIVVFGDGSFREISQEKFLEETPWIAKTTDSQTSIVLELLSMLEEEEQYEKE